MSRPAARWAVAIAAVLAVQALSWLVAPMVAVPPVIGASVVFGLVAGGVLLVGSAVPAFGMRALAWVVLPALLIAGLATMERSANDLLGAAAVAAALLGGGSLVGGVIGGRIQHASHLLVVAYVSSLADVFSVFSDRGVSAQVVASERLLSVLAISWPMPGSGELMPVLGVGDVIMCALYLCAARQLGLGVGRTAAALGAGFVAVLVALFAFQVPLPALPALGLAVVIALPRTWRLRREERWKAIGGMAVITVLFGLLML